MAAPNLTPLQRAIYEVDQLGLGLRDSMRLVTQRIGFFVGQQRYLAEQQKVAAFIAQYGEPPPVGDDPMQRPRSAPHQVGSP